MKKNKNDEIKTTLRLPRQVWSETRIAAIRKGMNLTDYVAEALTAANKKAGAP